MTDEPPKPLKKSADGVWEQTPLVGATDDVGDDARGVWQAPRR
jgi:hypothetical protein